MRKSQHGFTLPELLTAIGIIALLAAIATPTLRQFSASSRASAANNSLVSALATARMEALRRSLPVTVCSSINGTACASANDWKSGWIVFTDVNSNGTVDGADQVLQAWSSPGTSVLVTNNTRYLTFSARGMVTPPARTVFNTYVLNCTGQNQTQLVVTAGSSFQGTRINCP